MAPHQQRVVDEERALQSKCDALLAFLATSVYAGLPFEERERLARQLRHMTAYAEVLRERIAAFPPAPEAATVSATGA